MPGGERRELHHVLAGHQVREGVGARCGSDLREDRGAGRVGGDEGGAVRLVEGRGHASNAGFAHVLDAVAVRVLPDEVAHRHGTEQAEVEGQVVLA